MTEIPDRPPAPAKPCHICGATVKPYGIPSKSKFKGERIDPEIVDLIIDLNKHGFKTYLSCAGHGTGYPGLIELKRGPSHESIKAILSWHGLTDIKVRDLAEVSEYGRDQGISEGTEATFNPIGLSMDKRIEIIKKKRGS